ncbi:ABC transporter permease [Tessaracoccus sp. OS52]|uniref:ABC transporter permease n=1 Tax=Tessaracoccus sp. OS52 TaxID=2886691 RepID=UPI002103EC8F|nr:ABC transporter permease subunit [Tessaracoccus sp. OS52]
MSLVPVVLSLLIAVPIGWASHRNRVARKTLLPFSSILYALPSLPLFVVLPVLLGTRILDPVNVVVALTIYGVALLVRTVTDAFDNVGLAIRDDALAVGHSRGQVFWRVALPLAGPAILAGLRVVSASTLSLVSVGALIGVPSLGYFFTDGYRRAFPTEIWVGIVGTVLLAAVFDLALVVVGRVLMPWVRATDRNRP